MHLFVEHPLQVAVNSLKAVAARRLKQHFRMRTYRGHLWSPPYFAAPCDGTPLRILRKYVKNQWRPA